MIQNHHMTMSHIFFKCQSLDYTNCIDIQLPPGMSFNGKTKLYFILQMSTIYDLKSKNRSWFDSSQIL